MSYCLNGIALAAALTVILGSAAAASEINVATHTSGYGQHEPIADYDVEAPQRHHRLGERWYERLGDDRHYGRPNQEWQKPVFAEPAWIYGNRCRIIVRERMNRWGELVEIRRKICR